MGPYTVTYNTFQLNSANVLVSDVDHASSPDITANLLPLAKTPRSSVTSALKQQKTITIKGTILSLTNSVQDCTQRIRTYNGYLVGQEQTLTISDGTTALNYIATVNKNTITRPQNLAYAAFTTTFLCSVPFGTDSTSSSWVTATGRTAASYSDAVTVGGTTQWQTPVIQVTITAVTGGTNASITIGNAQTGQACKVTRNWTNGDVLLITTNSLTAPVTVNGNPVVFTGALPNFNPSTLVPSQVLTYNDTFATRTLSYSAFNFNAWDL